MLSCKKTCIFNKLLNFLPYAVVVLVEGANVDTLLAIVPPSHSSNYCETTNIFFVHSRNCIKVYTPILIGLLSRLLITEYLSLYQTLCILSPSVRKTLCIKVTAFSFYF